ncbi:MAG TPA: response regulator [Rhodopila sp.]|jgi:PAS domain S-box-containing protein|nr:response regulator [Rhodopila sp.]
MNVLPATRMRPLVLNVDDDPANRYVKTRSLALGEFEVIEAADGATALALIAQRQPLLVLLDVNLPDVDGLEVCRRIKAEWPDMIVIQISATATSTADKVIGLASGADCYLTTPVEPIELIAVARAMLRLRHAETQAQEANERYRMIVESAVDYAIFTCGLDGRITGWNSGAQAILGYPPDDIVSEHLARIFMADDIIADVPDAEMRAAHQGMSVRAERWHRRRDGTRFWSSGRMVALRDRRGQVAGYLKILHDRSVEKEARDALEALNAELEERVAKRTRDLAEANERLRAEIAERERAGEQIRQLQKMEALGQLTGGIAHDFNNLLTAILGGLEVTRRRVEDPRSLRLIDSSISAAQRGAKLIAQLMAFARKQNLQMEFLPLNTLVREMQELLERSVGAAVALTYDLAPDAWPVMADANQVQTALLNLAINARDAMADGGTLRISTGNLVVAEAAADLAAGEYAFLCVEDTGTGMTDEVQARLFEPFFTTKEVGKGTGLGLAQVYGFVRQSGGSVRVHSVVGEGTRITILLPRAAAGDEVDAA